MTPGPDIAGSREHCVHTCSWRSILSCEGAGQACQVVFPAVVTSQARFEENISRASVIVPSSQVWPGTRTLLYADIPALFLPG